MSFRQDEKTNADTFQINLVTGYAFGGEGGSSGASCVKSWIPYVKYERSGNSDPKKQDVDALNPGLLFDTRCSSRRPLGAIPRRCWTLSGTPRR